MSIELQPHQGSSAETDLMSLARKKGKGGKTFWLEGSSVLCNGRVVRANYSPSLDRLSSGDRVGVRRTAEGALRFSVNGEELGGGAAAAVAAGGVPRRVAPVLEVTGATRGVTVTSTMRHVPAMHHHQQQQQGLDSVLC